MIRVAIATPSQHAANAARHVAEEGGGAVDTAIAAAIAAMVTEVGVAAPGSGAFLTVSTPDGRTFVYDGYMAVPGLGGLNPSPVEIVADMEYGGGVTTMVGPASIAVPGTWDAFDLAHAAHGLISFRHLVQPAITLSEGGFTLGQSCLYYLQYSGDAVFGHDPASRSVLQPSGQLVDSADKLHFPDAASTLRALADDGAGSLLHGELGARIAADLWERGSHISAEDFFQYATAIREPLMVDVGDWRLATNPVPAVGGAGLAALLSRYSDGADLAGQLEAQEELFSWRRGTLHHTDDRDRDIGAFLARLPGDPIRSESTVHISAVDSTGVACALTLSAGYGSGVIPTSTGMFMNNGIGELELVGDRDRLTPGERLNSNMAPSVLRSPDGSVTAIGSPGADRITSAMAAVIAAMALQGESLEQAIVKPRFHVAVADDGQAELKAEPGALDDLGRSDVHLFDGPNMYFGGVGAAHLSASGELTAVSDPRRAGVAIVV